MGRTEGEKESNQTEKEMQHTHKLKKLIQLWWRGMAGADVRSHTGTQFGNASIDALKNEAYSVLRNLF